MQKAQSESASVRVLNKAQYNYKGATNYKLQCKIGEGAVGEVYRAVHKQSQEVYAVKRVSKISATLKEQVEEINNERIVLSKLKHSSIVGMKAAWADKNHYYLVFDFALHGDLHCFLKKQQVCSQELALFFSAQILASLVYLRKQNVVHRDLKPANIVLNEKMQIQVTDFGTAKSMIKSTASNYDSSDLDISYISANSNVSALSGISGISTNLNTILSKVSNDRIPLQTNDEEDREELVGSEHYISPEMLELRQSSFASDLWAFGVMIFQFFVGQVPFKGKTQELTFELIKKCTFIIPKTVPKEAADLISKLLKKVPEERLGAKDIQDVMSHPFFMDIDFEKISSSLPPQKFELNKVQSILIKYLPQNKKINTLTLQKCNSESSQSPTLLTVQKAKKSQFCNQDKKIDLSLSEDSVSDISVNNGFKSSFGSQQLGEISPIKMITKTEKSKKLTSTFEEPRSVDITGELTGDFPERKDTASFGTTIFSQTIPNNSETNNEDVMLTTFAGKKAKLFFYTQRELLFLKDGTFCYKKKNKNQSNQIKLAVKPDDILKLQLAKKHLTITLKTQTLFFKFSSSKEANEWHSAIQNSSVKCQDKLFH